MGYSYSAATDCFVDEFYVYPAALTEAEIKYVLGNTDPFFPSNAGPLNIYDDNDINFKDYSNFADDYMEDHLWPAP